MSGMLTLVISLASLSHVLMMFRLIDAINNQTQALLPSQLDDEEDRITQLLAEIQKEASK